MTDVSSDTVLATGSGVARTLAVRTADMINPMDFGAAGLGSTYTLAANTSFTWQGTTHATSGWTLTQWQTIYPSAQSTSDTFDTVAFEAAATYSNAQHKGLFVPTADFYFNRPPSLGAPSVFSTVPSNVSGAQARVGGYLGPFLNFEGSGLPTIYLENSIFFTNTPSTSDPGTLFYITKDASQSTGTTGTAYGIEVETIVGPNSGLNEYGIYGIVKSSSTLGQNNIGIWGVAERDAGNGSLFGGILGASDMLDAPSSGTGGLVALELDLNFNCADNGANGATWGGTGIRKAIHFGPGPAVFVDFNASISGTVMTVNSVATGTITNGMYFDGYVDQFIKPGTAVVSQISGTTGGAGQYNISISNGTVTSVRMNGVPVAVGLSTGIWGSASAVAYFGQMFGVAPNTQAYAVYDARGAVPPAVAGSTNAVMGLAMTSGQVIEFAGDFGTPSLTQPAQRALGYSASQQALAYTPEGNAPFLFYDNGSFTAPAQISGAAYTGRTNGLSPAAGQIGELKSNQVLYSSPVSLTNGTITSLVTLSLTPGNWLVWGSFCTSPASGTSTTGVYATILETTGLGLPPSQGAAAGGPQSLGAGQSIVLPVGQAVFNTASAVTAYLNVQVEFSGGTMGGFGIVNALRIG